MLGRINKGYTLPEILVTLAIVSVLVLIASPSFVTTIKRDRIVTNASQFHNTFKYARSEAIKRDQTVALNVDGTDWVVSTEISGATTELKRFSVTHSSIVVAMDDIDISSIGGLTAEKEYLISDGDDSTVDLALCILRSGQSWLVEKPEEC